uniref:Uncharacterized protein n=1 Tax=Setaria digitata TaxID=48799 RepID=A0A915Q127_9BILA
MVNGNGCGESSAQLCQSIFPHLYCLPFSHKQTDQREPREIVYGGQRQFGRDMDRDLQERLHRWCRKGHKGMLGPGDAGSTGRSDTDKFLGKLFFSLTPSLLFKYLRISVRRPRTIRGSFLLNRTLRHLMKLLVMCTLELWLTGSSTICSDDLVEVVKIL